MQKGRIKEEEEEEDGGGRASAKLKPTYGDVSGAFYPHILASKFQDNHNKGCKEWQSTSGKNPLGYAKTDVFVSASMFWCHQKHPGMRHAGRPHVPTKQQP